MKHNNVILNYNLNKKFITAKKLFNEVHIYNHQLFI